MSGPRDVIIVAIDGPSGVGKTTTSKLVAAALGIPHIDTGAMYRAVGLVALERGVDPNDSEAAPEIARKITIEFARSDGEARVIVDGRDVTESIRRPEVSMAASTVSAVPSVRRILVEQQRRIGREKGGVLEGRDIGTKVFPDTPYKFFLTARPDVRADRRFRELSSRGITPALDDVRREMEKRDRQDSTRVDSPLSCDSSYTRVDTSDRSIEEVVEEIVSCVRRVAKQAD